MIVTTSNGIKIEIPKPVRPCPFCGASVSLKFDMFDGYGNHDHRKDTEGAIIECKNCAIHPKITAYNYDDKYINDSNDVKNYKRKKFADKVRKMEKAKTVLKIFIKGGIK